MARAWSAAFWLLSCLPAVAQMPFYGGAPQMAVAKIGADGRVSITYMKFVYEHQEYAYEVMVDVPTTRTVTEALPDGRTAEKQVTVMTKQPETRTATRMVTKTVTNTTAAEAAQVAAADIAGNAIDAADLPGRLREPTTVIFTPGPSPPSYYPLVFKPETLVLTVPPQAAMAPAPAAPAAPGEAFPQPEPIPPVAELGNPPPDVVFVSFGKEGTLDVRRLNEHRSSQPMLVEGDVEDSRVAIMVAVTNRMSSIMHLPAEAVEVSTADGKEVGVEALRQSLKKEGAAVASSDGKPVDPIWLAALKPSTLVIDGPEPDVGPGGQGGDGRGGGYAVPGAPPSPPAAPQPVPQPAEPQAVPQTNTGNAAVAPAAGAKATGDEQAVIDGTNAERKTAGLKPLTADPALTRAARGHAEAMAKANELNHTLSGKTMDDRLAAVGFQFLQAGENIAQGARTPAEAVGDWMGSPGHKANILTAGYERIGVGVATSATGERFWCQVFGTPWEAPAAPAAAPVAVQ